MALELKETSKQYLISDDMIADLFNGHVHPDDYLEWDSAEKVYRAMEIIEDFEQLLLNKGILEYM